MKNYIEKLKKHDLIKIIDDELDVDLQIAHLAYIEAKKEDSKVLLFTNPIKNKEKLKIPVIMNIFANKKALELVLGKSADEIADEIQSLLNMHIPKNFSAKLDLFSKLFKLKNIAPKRVINKNAACKQRQYSLSELPILKTWQYDAAAFITMGQVYTKSLDNKSNNLGMYRLQVLDENHLIMHFQLHKDANNFFYEYKKANKKMPVAIAIGDDPLHILCAQAPLPKGIFELMLYGFIKKQGAKLVKCDTNDLYVPQNSDFVIEGEIDVNNFAVEGPFGDHTGFYTPQGYFPVMTITKITGKNDAIYNATVVGKPPLEDKLMGYATERIFLPLLKTSAANLIDYKMPENGVFHNLILAKIKNDYAGCALALAHTFWGVGQMAFVKNAIFVDENAPNLDDYENLSKYILNNFNPKNILKSYGLIDELDHSTEKIGLGGKLALDACKDISYKAHTFKNENNFIEKKSFKVDIQKILALKEEIGYVNHKTYFDECSSNICIVQIKKDKSNAKLIELLKDILSGILILIDTDTSLDNAYMLVWRITNNFDAKSDVFINDDGILIIACKKDEKDGYLDKWPMDTKCNEEVIKHLISLNLVESNEEFFKKYEIF